MITLSRRRIQKITFTIGASFVAQEMFHFTAAVDVAQKKLTDVHFLVALR